MNFIIENITIDENSCWNWNKSCSSSGYGQFTKNKIYYNTHRYVYEILNGQIDSNSDIRHLCNNRKCCNPEHLTIGTHKENYYDSVEEHNLAMKKRRYKWFINNINYETLREASRLTGISQRTIIKYTDKETRIFDIKTYRYLCEIANCIPKI